MMTWVLVLFFAGASEPVVIHGFADEASCRDAASALSKAQKRDERHACVEVKPAPCAWNSYTFQPLGGR